jgi:hypothetical protein
MLGDYEMQSSKPALDVWDSCCLIGILNAEEDKLPALLAQTRFFETGAAILGLPIATLDEVVTLSDGTPAEEKVRSFLQNPYVMPLTTNLEVSFTSKNLRIRFDSKRMPDLYERAVIAGVQKDNAKKLTIKDSEVLAAALFYKADRLSTYDPFLIFLGREYLQKETGLLIDQPSSPFLPFPDHEDPKT